MNKRPVIILASSSPRRKELLAQIGIRFKAVPSSYEEDMSEKVSNTKLAEKLALGKALDIASKLKSGIVIGCDTFVALDSHRLGKPHDKKDAQRILKLISGKTMKVFSGIAVIDVKRSKTVIDHEITEVKMKKLTQHEIDSYIATGEPLDKAGAYAIQGIGAILIEKIDGCYSNVIGLPLYKLNLALHELGYDIWK